MFDWVRALLPRKPRMCRWFVVVDCPDVRAFDDASSFDPLDPDEEVCNSCNWKFFDHGWLNAGRIVCPGDWIVTDSRGRSRVIGSAVERQ